MYYCPIPFAGISGLFAIALIVRYWYIVIPCTVAFIVGILLFFRWLGGSEPPSEYKRQLKEMRKQERQERRERRQERRFNRKYGVKNNYHY